VLGSRREHPVGLTMLSSAHVVDQHPEIGILTIRDVLPLAAQSADGVDSRQKPQRRRLLIAGCAEKLTGKVQPPNLLALEVRPDLPRRRARDPARCAPLAPGRPGGDWSRGR